MNPRICIIFTPEGIDTVSVLSTGGAEVRREGHKICSYLEEEITNSECAMRTKLQKIKGNGRNRNARK